MINQSKKITKQIGLYIFDHPYRILVIAGSKLGKTNVVLNLIKR